MTIGRQSTGRRIRRLFELRNRYDGNAADQKHQLLQRLGDSPVSTANDMLLFHAALCFMRAFPDSSAHYRLACAQLRVFDARIRSLPRTEQDKLIDTGIAATRINYAFSFHVARWLARRAPGTVSIDWRELGDEGRLDELLQLVLHDSEDEYFNSGWVTGREWLELACGQDPAFDWLLAQLRQAPFAKVWSQAYDAASLPLVWRLGQLSHSKTLNRFPARAIAPRYAGMRRRVPSPTREIQRSLRRVERLSPRRGSRMIDVAMASLAVRHRETYHFNHANPRDVHVADVGVGVSVALFGLLPDYRFPLECTMGYLLLSNGVPIGYGGASILFRQVNTGVNIFDEYRGSEAAFLWVQVMRVYHQLTGCTRFIANPYQFGADNDEALRSGAFWFYYRLGYRPVESGVRKLARLEWRRLQNPDERRSSLPTLRRLASCDMHFTLPGARAGDLFDERWLDTSSMLATRELADAGGGSRDASARRLAERLARDIGITDPARWRPATRRGVERIAPFVAAARPAAWPADARRSLGKLLEAKGAPCELEFARHLCRNDQFLQALRKRCRAAER